MLVHFAQALSFLIPLCQQCFFKWKRKNSSIIFTSFWWQEEITDFNIMADPLQRLIWISRCWNSSVGVETYCQFRQRQCLLSYSMWLSKTQVYTTALSEKQQNGDCVSHILCAQPTSTNLLFLNFCLYYLFLSKVCVQMEQTVWLTEAPLECCIFVLLEKWLSQSEVNAILFCSQL